ncbi:uncharacterized protein H6S33_012575 [Morchella sextelata]|jgi:hypothetical protein|uniref:uncharacterized protein n=1 Tax=Morchella sextelata TaxID=1174677 RepID=UPI001D050601|nr:uncharacterized protein H6S33_012575 [Morchella sextelata]KAH0610029.1 hypothetical protein H6S33_012575 [Morchella sextelata]
MLLPSAIPCEYRATTQSLASPLRRSSRHVQQAAISSSSYRSPPLEEAPSFIASAPAGLFQTCRRLQKALSVDRFSTPPPPPPPVAATPPKKNSVQKRKQQAQLAPSTPRRPAPRTPIAGKNKRARDVAFPILSDENTCMKSLESDDSDHEFQDPFTTPRNKRVRLTTPPSPPNRNLRVSKEDESSDAEWSVDEDKLLVEMVLSKLNLSKNDWEECAKSLGGRKDAKSIGKRWEGLISSRKVGLKDKKRRRV